MAVVTFCLAAEKLIASFRGGLIETAGWRLWCRNG
jgi:hypothetical protein